MGKTLSEKLRALSVRRQSKVRARTAALVTEEMTLRDVRKARDLTQERIAVLLGIGQDSVSRLEKRTDLLLSTLQSYISAIGGELRLIAEFPDRPPVELRGLLGAGGVDVSPANQKTKKSGAVHTG